MPPLTIILFAGGGFAILLLVVGVLVSSRDERSLVDERLGKYLEEEAKATKDAQKSAPLTDWLNTQAEKRSWGENIAKDLARADLKFKVGEYLALCLIVASGIAVALFFVAKSPVIAVIGGVVGFFLPRFFVKSQQGKRLIKFNDQLSDMLNLMVNGLRAGYSTMQAMEAVSKELPSPICDEFRRVVQEMQLGVSMEKALDNLLRRIPSPDLDLVITAINVQREVGGNLAEILDTISHTIRERVRIKGEIRVLTSQVMYSGRFLSLLPFLLITALYFINPSYFSYFFKIKEIGYGALGGALLLVILGYTVMNKIGDIKI